MAITNAANAAKAFVANTAQPGDKAKWEGYTVLTTPAARAALRQQWGHAEFCRLQRLSFWGFPSA